MNAQGAAAPEAAPPPTEDERAARKRTLQLQNNLYGSTGLLRLSEAGSAAPGTFRVSMIAEWFTATGFLCSPEFPCPGSQSDSASHFGSTAALSITPWRFMEFFGSIRSYANSNDQGRPKLLQVLGDTVLGLKAFTPVEPGKIFRFGGEAQLLLVNGTGGVGLNGSGTGFRFRGLATADFTKPGGKGAPIRLHTNLGYHLDNTAQVVTDTETNRGGQPINRLERFGLGINRTDFFEWGLGIEGSFDKTPIRPFLEYTMDVPVNRQNYTCRPQSGPTAGFHDVCLGSDPGVSYFPSRISIGARALAWRGLSPMLAFDIGVTGKSSFMEEVAPQPPWMLYVGLGYAVDTQELPPVVQEKLIEKVVQTPPPPQYLVRGLVHEAGTNNSVPDAVVKMQGRVGGYTTGPEGKFETNNLEPGAYTFTITAAGFKDGQCSASVTPGAQPPPPAPGASSTPGMLPAPGAPPPAPGAAPGQPGQPGAQPGQLVAPGVNYVDIDCPLEALPKMGNIVGRVVDVDTGAAIVGASVVATDIEKKEFRATTDGSGAFRMDSVKPGSVTMKVEADKYLSHNESVDVKPREDAKPQIGLTARPKTANVVIQNKEIVIKKQIHFETDSAVIKGDSASLMEEITDVIQHNTNIRRIEVQGHTDNTGTPDHNLQLSQARSESVKAWLTSHAVDGSRLEAKGYGATRPRVPNVTAANRAMNRRVQFVILEQDKPAK